MRTAIATTTAATPISGTVVAVDANGADLGAAEVAAGCRLAAERGIPVMLFGPAAELPALGPGVEIFDAPLSVAKSADPAMAVRSNPEASIVQAARAVADGRAAALVSAGSTGAALASSLFQIRRAQGVHRPALAIPVPVPERERPLLLLDVGANADCRPEHLTQFAFLGAAFARALLDCRMPRVGLLSNGSEAERGNDLVLAAGALLRERLRSLDGGAPMELIGNIEGDCIFSGDPPVVDVVVADGFTGNVAIKLAEGVSAKLLQALLTGVGSNMRARAGARLLTPALRQMRAELDPEAQGGAYLLGLRKLVVIAHGRFQRQGFARAIERAAEGAAADVPGRTYAELTRAGALRERRSEGEPVRAGR